MHIQTNKNFLKSKNANKIGFFYSSLYILDISILSNVQVVTIFSHSEYYGLFVHCVKIYSCGWLNKQPVAGRRYRQRFWAERGSRKRDLGMQERCQETENKTNMQVER